MPIIYSKLLQASCESALQPIVSAYSPVVSRRGATQRTQFNYLPPNDIRANRTMSNTSPTPSWKQFLVIVPDFPAKLEAREASTAAHIERVIPKINTGDLSHLGVTLEKHPREESEPSGINGSFFVMKAESEKALRDFLKEDVLVKGGIWDLGNAKIFPCQAR